MHTSDSFLRFILDAQTDIHCTDSLAALNPEAFVWHELNGLDAGQNILFFDAPEGSPIRIKVFDSDSRQFLLPPQKGIFSFGKTEEEPRTIACSTYSIANTRLTEEDLLSKLLTAANGKNTERRTALVFTHTAFDRICRRTNTDGVRQMTAQLKAHTGKCTVYIRLPLGAAELQQLMQKDLSGCPLLQQVYGWVGPVLAEPPEPLLRVLQRRLGDQLIRFDQRTQDVQNLLLKQAVADPGCVDTFSQLLDQAEYLALCRWHCIGLFPAAAGEACFDRVSHRQLWERLQDEQFRSQLRSSTRKLRSSCAEGSIKDALLLERRSLPTPPHPVCKDELARAALGLELPEACRRKASWDMTLLQIKQNLSTLWNKPHNKVAREAALALCREARSAINTSNWDTVEEILQLLGFFSREICASGDRSEALSYIWEMGSQLVKQCAYVYGARVFGTHTGFDELVSRGTEIGDKMIIDMLRPIVDKAIRDYGRPNIVIRELNNTLVEERNRISEQIEQARHTHELLQKQEQERQREQELQLRMEALTSKYTSGVSEEALGPDDDLTIPIDANDYLKEHMYEKPVHMSEYDFQ